MSRSGLSSWAWRNALSLSMFGAFLLFLALQSVFGWHSRDAELAAAGRPAEGYWQYLQSGHFVEAVFENWESEFLQMGAFVLFSAYLVQRGSPESKPVTDGQVREEPDDPRVPGTVRPDSPWPVRRGGWALKLYENSLAVVLLLVFLLSFVAHLLGGTAQYNQEEAMQSGAPPISVWQFARTSEFWFQSMQNWQSEFLAVGALVVFSVFLRQRGSSQSKPVASSHAETG